MASERVVLPTDLLPAHYALELTPDLEACTFTCTEEIHVTVRVATSQVTLHAKEIVVESVTFFPNAADSVAPVLIETRYNTKFNTVAFLFDGDLPVGEGKLLIKFKGILNGDMAGFYKSTYSDSNGNKKTMASTQFEALDARRAFPCWDEPAIKATFAVTLVVPAHLTALSNMPELSVTHLPAKGAQMQKKVVFATSPKMSTYLLAWAVGEFDSVQGVTKGGVALRVFSPPGRASQGLFALDVGVRALDFFDDFFQVPYPLPKLDMICITEFAMGAMENWGLVTYRENALMIDEAKASPQSKQRVAIVVAHELAHQWFGNLVTMSWWDGLWLNEGFAAFMEHFCVDALCPEYKIWEQFTTDAFASAQRLDALRSSHPVIVPIRHAEEVEQVFDAISYCKGSTVVNMVHAILGGDQFRQGLQLYMRRHAYGNTETMDLWGAWKEVSGKDVPLLMKTWTEVTGYPFIKVLHEEWSQEGTEGTGRVVKVTLEQARFLSDGSAAPAPAAGAAPAPAPAAPEDGLLWSIPLVFGSAGGSCGETVIMDQKVQTFSVPVQGGWVKINAGQKALARVAHSKEMIARLRGAIARGEVAPVDRAALLLDGYALAKAGVVPLEDVVEVLRALDGETSSIAWSAIAGVLSGLHMLMEQRFPDSAVFAAFQTFSKKMVVQALRLVGWDAKQGEGHTDKLLRATVLGLLDTVAWSDPEVAAEAKRRFDAHWEDPAALPAEYKTTVYRIVLLNGDASVFDRVLKAYRDTEDNQERKYTMFSLGAVRDPSLKMRVLDWAVKSGEVKLQDFFYPIGSVASSVAGAEMAWQYYQDNFSTIKDMLSKASPSLMDAVIVNCIGRFCTFAHADAIEAYFQKNPLPQSSRRIAQSLENMRANAQMLEILARSQLATEAYWA